MIEQTYLDAWMNQILGRTSPSVDTILRFMKKTRNDFRQDARLRQRMMLRQRNTIKHNELYYIHEIPDFVLE